MDSPQEKGLDVNDTTPPLIASLEADHRQSCRLAAHVRALRVTGLAIALLILLFTADALLILPSWARLGLDLGGLGLLVYSIYFINKIKRTSFDAEAAALSLERRGHVAGDEIVNAVQLSRTAPPGTSVSLREASVHRGAALAATTHAGHPPDRTALRIAGRCALGAAALAGLLAIVMPKLVRDVGLRYLQPLGDHPPWSRLVFTLTQLPDPALAERPAVLRVHIDGPRLPDRAYLVFPEGQAPERIPLALASGSPTKTGVSFLLRIPRVEETALFFIDTPMGRSRRYALRVSNRPLLEGAFFKIVPPAYTGWPPSEERVTSHTLRALHGSVVTLRLDANLPLAASPLVWDHPDRHAPPPHALMPDPAHPRRVSGSWTATSTDRFETFLVGANGPTSDVPYAATFQVEVDRPPEILIESPEAEIIAPEDWTVDLAIAASDDVGVSRIEINVAAADTFIRQPTPLPADRTHPARAYVTHALDLAEIGATAGSRVRYYATAYDNHPSPAQSADSAMGIIHVITRDAYDEYMRQRYRMEDWLEEVNEILGTLHRLRDAKQDALRTLEALAEDAAANPDGDQAAAMASARAQLERFQEDLESFTAALTDRAELDQLYEWETPYKEWLRTTAEQIQAQHEAADDVRQALQPPAPWGPDGALATSIGRFAALVKPFDDLPPDPADLAQEWQEMADAMELLEIMQRLHALILAQRNLADRVEAVRQRAPDDPSTRELLERLGLEQERLHEALESIQTGIRQAADALESRQPELAGQARDLAQQIDTLKVATDQLQAADAAHRWRGDAAAHYATLAAEKLESLIGTCASQCQGAGQCLNTLLGLTPAGLHPSIEAALRAALTAQPGYSWGRTGLQGAGSGGMLATVGMVGPQYPSRGQSVSQRGASRQGRGGTGGLTGHPGDADAEPVNPEYSKESFRHAPQLRTIPVRFRRHADAYFERLHRDETGTRERTPP